MKITRKLTVWQELVTLLGIQLVWGVGATILRLATGHRQMGWLLVQLFVSVILTLATTRFFTWRNRCANDYICEQDMRARKRS